LSLELTVLLPCLNEARTLADCIATALACIQTHGLSAEVVVADNGSTDGSQEIATRSGARVISVPERGYGAALYHGAMGARGKFIIMADADGSYDLSDLMPYVVKLREGYDLVMGNRFAGGIKPGAMPWKNRYIGNPVLTGIGRVLFRTPVRDFHCGMRGFTREAFLRMDLRTSGMEFASEMAVKATLSGMRLTEVPTTLSPDGRDRPPHLRPWRDGWRHLRFMLLYSPRWTFLLPGLMLMAFGLILGVSIWNGPVKVGRFYLAVHTMAYAAAMVLIGYQAVLFALLTKTFAMTEGLVPFDARLKRMYTYVTLETGLVAGAALIGAGVVLALTAVWRWRGLQFGLINDPGATLRLVIPSVLALVMGSQTVLFSVFLSVLGLAVRRPVPVSGASQGPGAA